MIRDDVLDPSGVRMAVWMGRMLVVLLGLLLYRFGTLQLAPSEALQRRVRAQSGRPEWRYGTTLAEQGARGRIFDRNGVLLASAHFVQDMVVDPVEFRRLAKDRAYAAKQQLEGLLTGIDPEFDPSRLEEVLYRVDRPLDDGQMVPIRQRTIARGISPRDASLVRDALRRVRIPGVSLLPRVSRSYPHGVLVAQIVGVAGELESDPGGGVRGRMGFERSMDAVLAGHSGAFDGLRDAHGREWMTSVNWVEPPRSGNDIVLTLDVDLQRIAAAELQTAALEHQAIAGSVVVLDVSNGDVLAVTSWPTVDFESAAGSLEHLGLAAVQARYSPGSTLKPLFIGTALDRGAIQRDQTFDCGGTAGSKRIGRRTVREYSVNPEPLTAERILMRSSNVGAVTIAYERLGLDGMYDALEASYIASRPLRNFPGVLEGYFTPRKKANPPYTGPAFPQGYEIDLSPMAVARLYLALARVDDPIEPRLLASVRGVDFQRDEPVRHLPRFLTPETVRWLHRAMVSVVDDDRGTGKKARSQRYTLAAKSGTGQVTTPAELRRGLYNAWFCSHSPAFEPRIVVVAHLQVRDRGPGTYSGGAVSGPLVRRVIESTLAHLGVPEDRPRAAEAPR